VGSNTSPLRRIWLYFWCVLVLVFLVAPCILIVPISFSASQFLEFPPRHWSMRWYYSYFSSPEWRSATFVSIKLALATTLVATPFGTSAAYGILTIRSRTTKSAARQFFLSPMMVPSILVAVSLFLAYARIGLNGSFSGLLIADVALALPLVVIASMSGLETYDFTQEVAARSLGASRLRAFFSITVPQIWPAIMTGAIFAFITSFDEAVVAIFVSGGENETLTKRMFESIRDQIDPTVAAVSSVLMLLSVSVLLVTQGYQRRR
jgi:putative spermidine/putrescine transport system permease protein